METYEVSSRVISLGDPAFTIALPGRQDTLTSFFTSAYLALQTQMAGSLSCQSSSKMVESLTPVHSPSLTTTKTMTGNLRSYIHDKNKNFPWRLRLSFATDIARALAYLHARRCIHRDLKGENLLVTSNGRLKITDFGFARIAARNADESKRLTFCGTDSYMSPEILLGNEFDLPTDVYSLGVIFCEIASRKLADDNTFKRSAPSFAIDEGEVRKLASPDCPPAFVQLCIDCLSNEPLQRPTTRVILDRLREIEAEVLSRPSEADDLHVGTIKFMTGSKRPNAAPRIPSFGAGVGKDIAVDSPKSDYGSDDSDEERAQVVEKLSRVNLTSTWSSE
jgi:LIM domain kinase 1